jgi:L-ascorbate metabolism protein UlaG (beta-lactamase superfamily)
MEVRWASSAPLDLQTQRNHENQKQVRIMKLLKPFGAICLTVVWANACPAADDAAAQPVEIKQSAVQPSGAADATAPLKLLAGVVHLTDDDVRFRTAAGLTVFVDPVAGPTNALVVKSGLLKPDLILLTHGHPDHYQPAVLRQYQALNPKAIVAAPPDVAKRASAKRVINLREVQPGKSYTLAGIHFHTVPACFLEGPSHPRTNGWVGYVLQLDGTDYYVTGDTQPLPEMAEVKADVLFPLLYGCGGNLEQAVKMSVLTGARLVVPVHTGGQEEVIKRYLTLLPDGVQGAYYK